MLSEQERKELIEDAFNSKRKEYFAKARKINNNTSKSFDNYIKFLMSIQNIFGSFIVDEKKSVARSCKL